MGVTKDLREYDTFWEDLYMCDCFYSCFLKYLLGLASLLFVILFAQAVVRISRKKTVQLDIRDKILLNIALFESIFAFFYHIFSEHYIILFVIRVIKVLEQVTICLILVELNIKTLNLLKVFWLTLGLCIIAVASMVGFVIYEKTYEFLYERSFIWIVVSSIQAAISLFTFIVGTILMKRDPQWHSD
jgi:hypothetical protein